MKFLDQLMHMTESNRRDSQLQQPVYRTPEIILHNISDRQGLEKAYHREDEAWVHGDTLFVAGTHSWGDVWDDFKIPFHQTFRAQRYIDADRALKNNPQVKNLVGHSLGCAVVFELQDEHPERTFKTDTYGAPKASVMRPDSEDNHR